MDLKVLLWNLQDLFIFMDHYKGEDLSQLSEPKWQLLTTSFKNNKDLDKVIAISDLVSSVSPDIFLLTEVGGKETLNNLNQHFLNDMYEVLHFNSNSDRGIDIAILVKRESKLSFKSKFHSQKVFARGLHELLLTIDDKKIFFYLTHLKSKLNLRGKDFEGRSQRKLEVDQIERIIKKNCASNHHHILCGDLNGIIYKNQTEPELAQFSKKLGLTDALELLDKEHYERTTYLYFVKNRETVHMQLDYFLLSKQLKRHIGANTQVLDFDGGFRNVFPKDIKEKFKHPSDHYPYLLELINL